MFYDIFIVYDIPLHSRDYLKKTSIKTNVASLTKAIAKMKSSTEQTMRLE